LRSLLVYLRLCFHWSHFCCLMRRNKVDTKIEISTCNDKVIDKIRHELRSSDDVSSAGWRTVDIEFNINTLFIRSSSTEASTAPFVDTRRTFGAFQTRGHPAVSGIPDDVIYTSRRYRDVTGSSATVRRRPIDLDYYDVTSAPVTWCKQSLLYHTYIFLLHRMSPQHVAYNIYIHI